MKIEIKESGYFSNNDEARFYEGLNKIIGFKNVSGSLDFIKIEFNDTLSDEDLREILSLFMRYGLDMTQLGQFLTDDNKYWFYNKPTVYWHNKIWGTEKNLV